MLYPNFQVSITCHDDSDTSSRLDGCLVWVPFVPALKTAVRYLEAENEPVCSIKSCDTNGGMIFYVFYFTLQWWQLLLARVLRTEQHLPLKSRNNLPVSQISSNSRGLRTIKWSAEWVVSHVGWLTPPPCNVQILTLTRNNQLFIVLCAK